MNWFVVGLMAFAAGCFSLGVVVLIVKGLLWLLERDVVEDIDE